MSAEKKLYDTLVIGGGIAGQEAALSLADMDHNVLLVEKEMSIGGKMIALSKVFPTLDCAACITTPKMSETARHPNISLYLNSTVQGITKTPSGFSIQLLKKPRYVKAEACTGCQECEAACPEIRNDKYNLGLVGSKVVNIPFALANPRIACIDRNDTSAPCINTCPGGVKPYGYISLVRNGQYEDAMLLHLEDTPIPGSLGRACYAPCQTECTRSMLEAPVDIRRIKRFFADDYYAKYPEPPVRNIEIKTGKRIAIVGSGPAGLTAAYFLALKGHTVKIFEAAPEAGGMLKLTIPEYRLPKNIVDRDIKNITSLGVEIEVNKKIKSIAKLKDIGYDSVFISVGTHDTRRLQAEGSDLQGLVSCLDFLREANIGKKENLTGKKVMVIGGGNTAIDAARTAIRMGATKVSIVYRRSREEMPSFVWEIKEAEDEGAELLFLRNPVRFMGEEGKVTRAELIKMQLGPPDASGRKSSIEIQGSEYFEDVDFVIEAIGLQPSTSVFSGELELNRNGTIRVNEKTLQTSQTFVFAGGDSVTGPTTIIEAVGQGKKAAFYIDKYLNGENPETFEFGDKLPAVDKNKVLNRKITYRPAVDDTLRPVEERIRDYDEIEKTFTEEEVILSALRCLDCSNCRECHQCASACPANAIDFSQKDETINVEVKSVVISTGFNLFKPENKPHYGYKQLSNVVDALQMDRLIAPTRPFNNILRPGDGKVPGNIAYVLCTGSRDSSLENNRACSTDCSNNPICSQICCMYSIKQAQLLMGALPMADITIYYIDIRAFGKGYEEFYQQTRSMGVNFVKGKVARIYAKDNANGDVILRYEDIATGSVKEMTHDMVVLSVGVLPNKELPAMFKNDVLELDPYNYVKQVDELINPARTTIEGVFVAGTASGPMDIPDSILSAGTAASEVASYLAQLG
jgi:heterodisulfide reductase subunit A-like polyferredoxin